MSYSHAMQDVAALEINKYTTHKRYLEIGANHPTIFGNNTALLEHLGWSGVSIEKNSKWKWHWRKSWRDLNRLMIADAFDVNYSEFPNKHFEFLQVDIEPPSQTYLILEKIICSGITANFITFEHDLYASSENIKYKNLAKTLLEENYDILCENVHKTSNAEGIYEDWFVIKSLKNEKTINDMRLNWLDWCYNHQDKYGPRHDQVIRS